MAKNEIINRLREWKEENKHLLSWCSIGGNNTIMYLIDSAIKNIESNIECYYYLKPSDVRIFLSIYSGGNYSDTQKKLLESIEGISDTSTIGNGNRSMFHMVVVTSWD